jgi:hypothetical protein
VFDDDDAKLPTHDCSATWWASSSKVLVRHSSTARPIAVVVRSCCQRFADLGLLHDSANLGHGGSTLYLQQHCQHAADSDHLQGHEGRDSDGFNGVKCHSRADID